MIDITAIIAEINAYLAALTIPFKSLETGRIRETVSAAQMPACDIAGGSATSVQAAGYVSWSAPITIVIRTQSAKRPTGATDARAYAKAVVGALTGRKGTAFDVLRNFSIISSDEEAPAGSGATLHFAVVTVTARKDI